MVVATVLAITFAGVIAVTKVGINMHRHPRKTSRLRRAKGEYQPPEPPEGRYWGMKDWRTVEPDNLFPAPQEAAYDGGAHPQPE